MESKQTITLTVMCSDIYIIQILLTLFEFNNQNSAKYCFCNSTPVHLMYDVFEEKKTKKKIKKIFLSEIIIFLKKKCGI